MELEWDCLIILDACRYDYFEKNYQKYFKGTLKKETSETNDTMKWANLNFPEHYPSVIYISTIPYINSAVETKDKNGLTFDGRKHFFEVIDCDWDEKMGTILPENVNLKVLQALTRYPDKKLIIHYLQPHDPYISENYKKYFNLKQAEENKNHLRQPDYIKMEEGIEGIRKAYEENLNVVMNAITEILPSLKGRILIIGDHGEYLGEHGLFGHLVNDRHKEIWEIPYLEVE